MTLYKNVDVQDLRTILKEGIKPLAEVGQNNWVSGKRSSNSDKLVYLFKVIDQNYFPQYGLVLLEIETEATENEIGEYDANLGLYKEYVCKYVKPEEIKRVFIPEIFKKRLGFRFKKLPVEWVKMTANYFSVETKEFESAPDDLLELLAETTPLNSYEFNFFRGITDKNEVVDFKDTRLEI